MVSRTGTILAGRDFSVTRQEAGAYRITFAPGRISGFPAASVTPFENIERNGVTTLVVGSAFNSYFDVEFRDPNGTLVDSQFSFVVIGAPAPAATAAASTNSRATSAPQLLRVP